MNTSFYFLVPCRQCDSFAPAKVRQLGERITCPHCHHQLTAHDPDLESAAMEEDISALAQSLDWPRGPLQPTTRPR